MVRKILLSTVAVTLSAGLAAAQSADMPPEADPGTCFARVLMPQTTDVVIEQVTDRPESQEIQIIPATYETVTEQVLVKEESVDYTMVPATYKTVTEQVLIEPERIEYKVVPAQYETYTEQVLVREAYVTWKQGDGLYGQTDASSKDGQSTGELLCRVEVPAEYETVTKTRLVSPERTDEIVIPAVYETVSREVVDTPAQVVESVVPAVYNTVSVQKLVTPATEEIIFQPASYKTIERTVVTGGGELEWRPVLCETNASPQIISQIQQALTDAGYNTPVDGEFGPSMQSSMEAYQRAKGLPVGYLTMSTVDALLISAPEA